MSKKTKINSLENDAQRINFFNYKGFHKSNPSIKTTYQLLGIFVLSTFVFYISIVPIFEMLLKDQSISFVGGTLINFFCLELLPVITFGFLITWFYYRKTKPKLFTSFKRWIGYIKDDFNNHRLLILFFSMVLIILNPLINFFTTIIFPSTSINNISNVNSGNIYMMIFENIAMTLAISLISPLIEEFLFRLCLPNILSNLFNKVLGNYFKVTQKRMSYIFSALFFASIHLGGSATIPQITMYTFAGLVLQFLRNKTGSITAPILVHITYNLVTSLLLIL